MEIEQHITAEQLNITAASSACSTWTNNNIEIVYMTIVHMETFV